MLKQEKFISLVILMFLLACQSQPERPVNSDLFFYVDKATADTSKFYGYRDLDTAISYAKKSKKNLLLVFSGWALLAESRLQWRPLALYENNDLIQQNFIIAWLAVDDRHPLRDTCEYGLFNGQKYRLKTIGSHYMFLQQKLYNTSSQPMFCFMDTLMKPYGKTMGYEKDKNLITDFIDSGLK